MPSQAINALRQGASSAVKSQEVSVTEIAFSTAEIKVDAKDPFKGGCYLVLFSTQDDPDLAKEFFTSETDFGSHKTSPVYWHHGLDPDVRKEEIGTCTLKADAKGVWMDYQLDKANSYAKQIADLSKKDRKKIGASSGTASHLVEREPVKAADGTVIATKITKWPLGIDASLTPTPCEPRTRQDIMPLKSYDFGSAPSLKSLTEGMQVEAEGSSVLTDPKVGDYVYPVKPMVGHSMCAKMAAEHDGLVKSLFRNRTISPAEYKDISTKWGDTVYQYHTGLNDDVSQRNLDEWDAYDLDYKGLGEHLKTVGDALHAVLTRCHNAGADHMLTHGIVNRAEHGELKSHFENHLKSYLDSLDEGLMSRDLHSCGSKYLHLKGLQTPDARGLRTSEQVARVLTLADDLQTECDLTHARFKAIKALRQEGGADLGAVAIDLLNQAANACKTSMDALQALIPPTVDQSAAKAVEESLASAKQMLASLKEGQAATTTT